MRNGSLLLLLVGVPACLYAQSPGGISNNLRVWLNAGKGVYGTYPTLTAAGNGSLISDWADQSGNGNNALNLSGGNSRPTYRKNSVNNINFLNPVVDFDGVNDNLNGAAGYYTNDIYAIVIPKSNISRTSGGVYYLCGDNPGGTYGAYSYIGGGNASTTGEVFGLGVGNSLQYQVAYTSASTTFLSGIPYILQSRTNPINTADGLYLNGLRVNNASVGSFRGSANRPWKLGNLYKDINLPSSYRMGELIIYSVRNSDTNKNMIQSYLAIKYGITLDQSTATDYYDSNGNVIYPASTTHIVYNNDIAGVGRDDASGLNQTKSKSVNPGSEVTMAVNSLASDRNFLVWGNNGVSIGSSNTTNLPAMVDVRLGKVWRIYKSGNFTIDSISIDLTGAPGTFDMSNLALLIDDDGDFSNASIVTRGRSVKGSVVTFTGINFNNINDSYFTVGSSAVSLAVSFLSLNVSATNNNGVFLEWSVTGEKIHDYYIVERTLDGHSWDTAGTIKGAGSNLSQLDYQYIDFPEVAEGTIYYRIKQTNDDGNYIYSDVKAVKVGTAKYNFQLYPNPNNGSFTIVSDAGVEITDLKIYDVLGKSRFFQYHVEGRRIQMDASGLRNGSYILVISANNSKTYLKYLVEMNN